MTEDLPGVQCPTCKQTLAPGVRFCPHDGTPLTDTGGGDRDAAPTVPGGRPPSRQIVLPAVVGLRYRLVALRGGGGMAKVYKANDLTLGRDVAVKLINPELRAESEFDNRFQREARIASQLADPHIVVVHDFGLDTEYGPYLVMEYLKGRSLREHLAAEGPLDLKAGLQLAAQLLLALIHAHEKNVIHRDIKPDNIFLLNQSGLRLHIRVLDFGIARILRDAPRGSDTLTNPGSVLGTPRYMPPEQLAGQSADVRSDLYSAAMVIHEALTGELPYISGKTLCQLCPEATPALQELIDRCLRPSPNERPASALEAYLQLQELGKASGIVLLPPGALEQMLAARRAENVTIKPALSSPQSTLREWRPNRRWLLGGLAILLLCLAVPGLLLIRGGSVPRRPLAESLLGIRIGDSFPAMVDRLQLTHGPARAWAAAGSKSAAPVFLPSAGSLHISEHDLLRAEVRWNPDNSVAVVGVDDAVLATVVRKGHRGTTGRGVSVGAAVGNVYKAYDDDNTPRTEAIALAAEDGGGRGEIRYYDVAGVAFVIHKGKVSAIVLYPPTN
jgi:serine/threonine protein kinase